MEGRSARPSAQPTIHVDEWDQLACLGRREAQPWCRTGYRPNAHCAGITQFESSGSSHGIILAALRPNSTGVLRLDPLGLMVESVLAIRFLRPHQFRLWSLVGLGKRPQTNSDPARSVARHLLNSQFLVVLWTWWWRSSGVFCSLYTALQSPSLRMSCRHILCL